MVLFYDQDQSIVGAFIYQWKIKVHVTILADKK